MAAAADRPPLARPAPLDADARARSERQRTLAGLGDAGQALLAGARVLVVGAGGIGCPALVSLVGAGVATGADAGAGGVVHVVDDDVVSLDNLHRQTLYRASDVGSSKALAAVAALAESWPGARLVPHVAAIDAALAARLVADVDVVLDCTGDASARAIVERACDDAGVPMVWGAALGWHGQVAVWWASRRDLGGMGWADVFGDGVLDPAVCATAGVLPPICQAVGAAMALEAIKLLTGAGRVALDAVLDLDGLRGEWTTVPVRPREHAASAAGAVGAAPVPDEPLGTWDATAGATLVDVREPGEQPSAPAGARALPLSDLEARGGDAGAGADAVAGWRRDRPLRTFCVSGARARRAAALLRDLGFTDVAPVRAPEQR